MEKGKKSILTDEYSKENLKTEKKKGMVVSLTKMERSGKEEFG